MPMNPYDSQYGRTAAMIRNYDGDLEDLMLDTDDFDGSEQDALAQSGEKFHTLEDDPIDYDIYGEPEALDFGEAAEELAEGDVEDPIDAKTDMMLNKVASRFNPQRINAIVSGGVVESTFVVPQPKEGTKSLGEYVKAIEESYNNYISKKLENYSK